MSSGYSKSGLSEWIITFKPWLLPRIQGRTGYMHHYIETTHPLVHRSTIWLKTFVGQIFTVLNIIHKNLTTLQTTPFSCNRCGLWPEFWEFACVQWQGIVILVVQRRYWSCWLLCTEIRLFSIAFVNVEVKNVLEELVGNRKQGRYIKL